MELSRLIAELARPEAYPGAVDRVQVAQTHISVVFIAGSFVYKIKKPVQLGFLDFSTLEKRRHFCEQEVVLNRRLAPDVYLGVVPVTREPGGRLRMEGTGDTMEWAVKMRHLPEDATLQSRLELGEPVEASLRQLAARLAAFHRDAAQGGHISSFGRFDVVAGNARENFTQSEALVGITVSRPVFDRLRQLTEGQLKQHIALIQERADRGVIRDTHGDLRLEHVYLFPDKAPPGDVVILDCIEFNERFRYADPVSDIAFLVMDLEFQGHRDLARLFAAAYLDAAQDCEGEALLPFYTAYRSVVRGKVEGFKLKEWEVSAGEKEIALGDAHAHWLLALGELEEPAQRPALVLVGGLPGTGKSTLARGLAEEAGFALLRSDVIRKEMAGLPVARTTPEGLKASLYSPDWSERTYRECLRQAEDLLFEGRRVLVDASFRRDHDRRLFHLTARRWGVPSLFLHCEANPDVVRERLRRRAGDASDADWDVYERLAEEWEPVRKRAGVIAHTIDTSNDRERAMSQALAILRDAGLAE